MVLNLVIEGAVSCMSLAQANGGWHKRVRHNACMSTIVLGQMRLTHGIGGLNQRSLSITPFLLADLRARLAMHPGQAAGHRREVEVEGQRSLRCALGGRCNAGCWGEAVVAAAALGVVLGIRKWWAPA